MNRWLLLPACVALVSACAERVPEDEIRDVNRDLAKEQYLADCESAAGNLESFAADVRANLGSNGAYDYLERYIAESEKSGGGAKEGQKALARRCAGLKPRLEELAAFCEEASALLRKKDLGQPHLETLRDRAEKIRATWSWIYGETGAVIEMLKGDVMDKVTLESLAVFRRETLGGLAKDIGPFDSAVMELSDFRKLNHGDSR